MTYSSSDRTRTNPVSDKDIIVDQEVRYADGSVQKHREKLSSNDPAAEARIERARLEMDRQLKIRDNDNAARGLLVGVIATTFLGLGILAWYILTHQQETEVNPVVVPAQPAEPSTPPDINITLPNPPTAETTETAPAPPTIIQTQPAPPQQPSVSTPPSSETAPPASPEASASEPTNSAAPDQPVNVPPTETTTPEAP
ncbi:hypothetical protein [Acaryochloris sp. CCMEE 5410]|uniref:hypothetical protein n=1 Tax=Acaryochloris sp. CCMEE 5410 TaxID=310037 RepID=UPI0002484DFD|nr:hypothetical protein [Acaryochloris sp. CCMEE 5410]KAI9131979.1 hypothetical protein ON05_000165 [Acaryochloris sp. CCMEE 5410]